MGPSSVWQRRNAGEQKKPLPNVSGTLKQRQQTSPPGSASVRIRKSPQGPKSQPRSEKEIMVYLRIRPPHLGDVTTRSNKTSLSVHEKVVVVPAESVNECPPSPTFGNSGLAAENSFQFDFIFDDAFSESGQKNGQVEVFKAVGMPCVQAALDGLNSTIMAYGQTGSGKTFTMSGGQTEESQGLISRAAKKIVEGVEETSKHDPDCYVQVSILEIYQEKLRDLLGVEATQESVSNQGNATHSINGQAQSPAKDAAEDLSDEYQNGASTRASPVQGDGTVPSLKASQWTTDTLMGSECSPPSLPVSPQPLASSVLRIREHPEKGPFVAGLTRRVVSSWSSMAAVLSEGISKRMVGSTSMNVLSSRSHAIVTLSINQKKKKEDGTEFLQTSNLHLVDLAGSERQSRTQASGMRLKESGAINKSLSLLNNVITQLAAGSKFVAYRDSSLTWLLKESLGGNSRTSLVACVSPAWQDLKETISTLRYASSASRIQNKPVAFQDPKDLLIQRLAAEVSELRVQLSQLKTPILRPMSWVNVGVQVPESAETVAGKSEGKKRQSFSFKKKIVSQQSMSQDTSKSLLPRQSRTAVHPEATNPLPVPLLSQSSFAFDSDPSLPSLLNSPLMTSIPSPSGHHAQSELLQRVTSQWKASKKQHPSASHAIKGDAWGGVPLPELDLCPSLLALEAASRSSLTPASSSTTTQGRARSPRKGNTLSRIGSLTWVQRRLPPGITTIGSGHNDISIPGLEREHCEILHVPELGKVDGTWTPARVSVLLYAGAKASVNGQPLLRYALLEHGAQLTLGEPPKAVFYFYDPESLCKSSTPPNTEP